MPERMPDEPSKYTSNNTPDYVASFLQKYLDAFLSTYAFIPMPECDYLQNVRQSVDAKT